MCLNDAVAVGDDATGVASPAIVVEAGGAGRGGSTVIITNAALRGREGTWDIHMENANFGSIVASPADSDNREAAVRMPIYSTPPAD